MRDAGSETSRAGQDSRNLQIGGIRMSTMRQQDDWRSSGACLGADPDLFFPISLRTQRRRAAARSAASHAHRAA